MDVSQEIIQFDLLHFVVADPRVEVQLERNCLQHFRLRVFLAPKRPQTVALHTINSEATALAFQLIHVSEHNSAFFFVGKRIGTIIEVFDFEINYPPVLEIVPKSSNLNLVSPTLQNDVNFYHFLGLLLGYYHIEIVVSEM